MWVGRGLFGVIVAGLVVYLVAVGLDQADKLASGIGAVLALVALAAPYLFPPASSASVPDEVRDTGAARASAGGHANTGIDAPGDERAARVTRSGDATADGPGSAANTGVQRRPRS
ncbi:hypothetical protein BJY16_006502 [Actinoplanes octamycinicus]|uniref:Uncharacterized protein n=1 Tax=Actinoplanes octamycinicus TaxID=135948 RepID=A0A7W7MAG9_9ACTN|nr:hypothetical protein [Actinoplanes octamycinicus]GIE58102.1 hypothetical protein Aoc01nite_35040 [Actinoplanes octamycinicus]